MKIKSFVDTDGLELVVKSRKSAIIFELKENQEKEYNFKFIFNLNMFDSLYEYIKSEANECWTGIILKEADSIGSDYCEYYDKELDSEGCLDFIENGLRIERPALENKRLYQFDKRKIQSFLYDFKKKLKK